MKLLLTGATGFLGGRVAEQLTLAGHELRLLLRPGREADDLPEGADIVRGDVVDGDAYLRAAEGCQAILHMAALVKNWVPRAEAFDAVNVGGVRHALAAAKASGARLLYTSSFMAIGPTGPDPVDEAQHHPGDRYCNAYERTKALADEIALRAAAEGQDVVLLYPGVVYGPGRLTDGNLVVQMLLDHLLGLFPGYVGPGDRLWSYAFVDDVAAGHVRALERGRAGERYILGGENATLTGLFERLEDLTGTPPPRRHIPYGVAALLGRAMVAWADLTGHPPKLTHEVVEVFRRHWAYSSGKAVRELGYSETPLQEGLARTAAWLRQEGRL